MHKIAKECVARLKPKLPPPAYRDYSIRTDVAVKCADLNTSGILPQYQ